MNLRRFVPNIKAISPDLRAAKNVFEDRLSFVVMPLGANSVAAVYAVILPHDLKGDYLMDARLAIAEQLHAAGGIRVLIDMQVSARIEIHVPCTQQSEVAEYVYLGPARGLPPQVTIQIELCICRARAAQNAAS